MKFFPDRRGLVGGLTTAPTGSVRCSFRPSPPIGLRPTASRPHWNWSEWRWVRSSSRAGCCFGVSSGLPARGVSFRRRRRHRRRRAARLARDAPLAGIPADAPSSHLRRDRRHDGDLAGFTIAKTQMGLDVAAASMAVSFVALANTFGRLSAGAASDYLGRVRTLGLGLAVTIAGLECLTRRSRCRGALLPGAPLWASPSGASWGLSRIHGPGLRVAEQQRQLRDHVRGLRDCGTLLGPT